MKTMITLSVALLSLNAFANESYKCHNVEEGNTDPAVTLKITTRPFSKKISAVRLVHDVKGKKPQTVENPFTAVDASYKDLDPNVVADASMQNFMEFRKTDGRSETSISLSESLLGFQESGFARFYAYSCFWILECFTTSDYYKCDKL